MYNFVRYILPNTLVNIIGFTSFFIGIIIFIILTSPIWIVGIFFCIGEHIKNIKLKRADND